MVITFIYQKRLFEERSRGTIPGAFLAVAELKKNPRILARLHLMEPNSNGLGFVLILDCLAAFGSFQLPEY